MSPEQLEKVADFKRRHRPDTTAMLAGHREVIVHLHGEGYSLALIWVYLQEQGVQCSRSAFYRWVTKNVDFDQARTPPPVQASPTTPPKPSLPLPPKVDPPSRNLDQQIPKPPVLVDNKGSTDVDSAAERAERLRQARALRDANFVNPVERALGGKG